MIALSLALIAQAVAAPAASTGAAPLGPIGRQALPAKGCATFLWSAAGDRQLVAMATADPAQLRIAVDGKAADYQRSAQSGPGGFGFAGTSEYRGGDLTVTVDLTITTDAALTAGAQVPTGAIRIDRAGRDTLIVPVAGLIGCAA